jgi:hypothetical protein
MLNIINKTIEHVRRSKEGAEGAGASSEAVPGEATPSDPPRENTSLVFDDFGKPVNETPATSQTTATTSSNTTEPIIIGGKRFDNAKDAWSYAEQLEQENNSLNAYSQGLRDGTTAQPSYAGEPEVEAPLITDDEYYENPVEAVKKATERASQKVTQQIQSEQTRVAQVNQFWDEFYTRHGDLGQYREFCDFTLKQNMDQFHSMRDYKLAQDKLANMIRKKLNIASSNQTTLPNTTHDASPGGTSAPITSVETAEPEDGNDEVDFATQIKQHQNKKRQLNYGE